LVNFLTRFLRDYQLALNREGLTHRPIIVHLNCRRLKSLFVFPPGSKEARFPNVSGISYEPIICPLSLNFLWIKLWNQLSLAWCW
jgi:hypothetical protein